MTKIRFKDYLKDYLEINHIANNDFANRIGVTPKTLIDILSGNLDLSAKVIQNISLVTGIPADYIFDIELNYQFEERINQYLEDHHLTITDYLNKFNYLYLKKNNYIRFIDREDKMEMAKDILKFLRVSSPEQVYQIETNAYFKSKNDHYEFLLLWLEKCYRETISQKVKDYHKENIDVLIQFIHNEALNNKFNKKKLIQKFNECGVFLVIMEDIPGSKIRGAFKVHKGIPAIYLTLKHKRIADIYFALLHEVAHLKTDFNSAQKTNLISFLDHQDELEEKRDKDAFNWMVDDQYYNEIKHLKSYDLRKEKKYPKCFIAYRMAHDKLLDYHSSLYQEFNIVIETD